jgi:multimeric flavodoxin WrbA
LVVLDGSPHPDGAVATLLAAVADGARAGGAEVTGFRAYALHIAPCIACGPDATPGYCVLRDDMDRVYAALEQADAVVVGSPVYFDTVSGPLKLLIDRCNCVTPLVTLEGGTLGFRPKWARTRRAAFVTACSESHPHELAERTVRGFLKWIGARWERTLAWRHPDDAMGGPPAALRAEAEALGRDLTREATVAAAPPPADDSRGPAAPPAPEDA